MLAQRSYNTMADSHRAHDDDDSSSSLFIPQDDHYSNEQSSRRRRLVLPPRASANRFAGDGFDYRRPVMGNVTSAAPVIDLTDEDNTQETDSQSTTGDAAATATAGGARARRLPRFGRDVMDVDDDPEVAPAQSASRLRLHARAPGTRPQYSGLRRPARFRQPTPPDMDDDLEIVSERALSRPQTASRQHTPAMPNQRSVTPYPGDLRGHEPIDLTNDDDVVITDARTRAGGINAGRPGTTAGVGTRSEGYGGLGVGHIADILRGEGANLGNRLMQRLGNIPGFEDDLRAQMQTLERFEQDHNRRHGQHQHIHHHNHNHNHGGHVHRALQFVAAPPVGLGNMPGMMDFDTPAFEMGYGGNRPPTPKYSPPPEPEKGFTRSPEEADVVVCPNCGDELAMGEDEVKQQVWAVKGCGHVCANPTSRVLCLWYANASQVYCGQCAQNRTRTISKKDGKARVGQALPSPFKKCVVEGCAKSTGKSNMFQVYLGS